MTSNKGPLQALEPGASTIFLSALAYCSFQTEIERIPFGPASLLSLLFKSRHILITMYFHLALLQIKKRTCAWEYAPID
jgi:hypothetical protein